MNRIVLEKYDEKISKKMGQWIEEDELKTYKTINENMTGYDGEGNFLFCYLKGVIPENTITDFGPVSFPYQNGRGMSAGKIDDELMKKIEPKTKYEKQSDYKFIRYNKKTGKLGKYKLSNPVRSNIVGYFDYINYVEPETPREDGRKDQHINVKITNHTNPRSLDCLDKITHIADNTLRKVLPNVYINTKDRLDNLGFKEYLYKDTLFTTITINTDFRTALHRDSNNYNKIGVLCVMSSEEKEFEGGELVLPEYKSKISMRPNDILVFNSDLWHHNTEIKGSGRYSFVFYIRDKIVRSYEGYRSKIMYNKDMFIDYDLPCILLKKGYKNKQLIEEYSIKHGLNIYYLTGKTSFNNRKFGNTTIRNINKDKEKLFTNPLYESRVYDTKVKSRIKREKKINRMEDEIKLEGKECDYQIAVRSYGRSVGCRDKTLKFLEEEHIPKEKITIFVNEREVNDYKRVCGEGYTYVVGNNSIPSVEKTIIDYYDEDVYYIHMDDDCYMMTKSISSVVEGKRQYGKVRVPLLDIIYKGKELLDKTGLSLFGLYTNSNSMFSFDLKRDYSFGLYFILGNFFGVKNKKDIVIKDKFRDDYERSILFYLRDGGVVKMNRYFVKADLYKGEGGLNGSRNKEGMNNSAEYLLTNYPDYVMERKRKSKYREVDINKRMRTINNKYTDDIYNLIVKDINGSGVNNK